MGLIDFALIIYAFYISYDFANPNLQLVHDMTGNNGSNILDELGRQAAQVSSTALSLPRRIDDTIEKLERGDIPRGGIERDDVERIRIRYCGLKSKYRKMF